MPYDDTYADDQHKGREAALERRRQMKAAIKNKGLDPLGNIIKKAGEYATRPSSFGDKRKVERVRA